MRQLLLVLLALAMDRAEALTVGDLQAYIPDLEPMHAQVRAEMIRERDHPDQLRAAETRIMLLFHDPHAAGYMAILDRLVRVRQIVIALFIDHRKLYTIDELRAIWQDHDLLLGERQTIGMVLAAETGDAQLAGQAMAASFTWFGLFQTIPVADAPSIFRVLVAHANTELVLDSADKPAVSAIASNYDDALRMLRFQNAPEDVWQAYLRILPPLLATTRSWHGTFPLVVEYLNHWPALEVRDPIHFRELIWQLYAADESVALSNFIGQKVITEEQLRGIIDAQVKRLDTTLRREIHPQVPPAPAGATQ